MASFLANHKKGLIAENIVRDMFLEAGFEVIHYGYEYTLPKLTKRAKIEGKAGEYIRHQPDFIVINKSNEAFFVEVKFRSYKIDIDKEIFPYPNCYIVLLTKDYILAQSTRYLFKKSYNFMPITRMPPFKEIPSKVIYKYVRKVRRQLGDDTLSQQVLGSIVKKFTNLELVEKPSKGIKVIKPLKKRFRKRRYRRTKR